MRREKRGHKNTNDDLLMCAYALENRERERKKKTSTHTKATKQCACQTKKKDATERRKRRKWLCIYVYVSEGREFTRVSCVHQFFFSLLVGLQTMRKVSTSNSCICVRKKELHKIETEREQKQTHGM
jgi:hypothetical protein